MPATSSPKLPTEAELFEIIARLHTETPQQKYQYSNRVLKYARIGGEELDRAYRLNPSVTEQEVWRGRTQREVADRVAGNLTRWAENAGEYRTRWTDAGLPEGSWAHFVSTYCLTRALDIPMNDSQNHRPSELDNFLKLVIVFQEEVFDHLETVPFLKESLKSKWWKECHKPFAAALGTIARDSMQLPNTPEKLCHTQLWTPTFVLRVRTAARRWREHTIWQTNEVDFTVNNERNIKELLVAKQFTEAMFSRDA